MWQMLLFPWDHDFVDRLTLYLSSLLVRLVFSWVRHYKTFYFSVFFVYIHLCIFVYKWHTQEHTRELMTCMWATVYDIIEIVFQNEKQILINGNKRIYFIFFIFPCWSGSFSLSSIHVNNMQYIIRQFFKKPNIQSQYLFKSETNHYLQDIAEWSMSCHRIDLWYVSPLADSPSQFDKQLCSRGPELGQQLLVGELPYYLQRDNSKLILTK